MNINFKVLLYLEHPKALEKSGISRALTHQKMALDSVNIPHYEKLKYYKDVDIVDINTVYPYSIHALKKMKKKGKTVVVHGHSTYEDLVDSFRFCSITTFFMKKFIHSLYSKADIIITPTTYSKGLIENYVGVKCPIYSISNGVNLKDYEYDETKINKFKEKFNIKEGQKVVIGVGWYFYRKGIDTFFEVARKMPDTTFIWFGHKSRIMTTSKVNKFVKKRPKNVILPGYICGEIIQGAMHYASALLFPSREETEGIVVLEALASKLPVVIRDIPVYKDWLSDKVHCLKANDVDEFVSCLNEIMSNDMSKMTDEGYKVAQERSIEKIGLKLKEVYIEALKKK